MNVLSLFDGISCGRVALERAGFNVNRYYASEIDKYAIRIAQKNYPDTIQLGDVNDWKYWNIDWDNIDLLIGGSPCQDLSIANKERKGLDGERSGLFWKYVEILHRARPKYFLLENNYGMPEDSKQIITNILGVQPILINSNCFSAQNRKRLYWTNIPVIISNLKPLGICINDIKESNVDKKYYMRYPLILKNYTGELKQIGYIPKSILKDNERQRRVYSEYSLCPSLLARSDSPKILCENISYINNNNPINTLVEVLIRKLTPLECERLQTLPDNYTEGVSNTQRYKMIGNGWTVDVIAHILSFIPKEDRDENIRD